MPGIDTNLLLNMYFEKCEFNDECDICGKSESENGRRLDVHHVNYDKNCLCNEIKCEFVPLCMSCHGKTNGKRDENEQFILNKLNEVNP